MRRRLGALKEHNIQLGGSVWSGKASKKLTISDLKNLSGNKAAVKG